ncbi:response regulator transcription factor [soil metagenome]
MVKILIVEDEPDLSQVLAYNVRQSGDTPLVAGTGAEAFRLAKAERPELILLDLMLPDMPGADVCRAVKRDPLTEGCAVVIVSAKGEEIDRVVGFEIGADDYVVKPFSPRELMLRVAAVLRRLASEGAPKSASNPEEGGSFGTLRIDKDAHRVWVSAAEVELTALEFRLLSTLFERKNRVQTRNMLIADVWGSDADVTARAVDTHVKRLREKLGAAGDYVETVRGVGYRFAASPS